MQGNIMADREVRPGTNVGVINMEKSKTCFWCKKVCPESETGDFEMSPDDENEIVGWVCDHCILAFNGECDCAECSLTEAEIQKARHPVLSLFIKG
jgi:hypothetical protein